MVETRDYEDEIIINLEGFEKDSEEIVIETNKRVISMYHEQDCCEGVYVDDVVGNIDKHIGAKLHKIIEKTSNDSLGDTDREDISFTYTFYTIATSKGYIDVRWFGSSNGYYSESVTISERKK